MRNLIGLVTALITTAISLASCWSPESKCKPFEVGQKVHVMAYPTEHYVVIGVGLACTVELWRPNGGHGWMPAATLEVDPS